MPISKKMSKGSFVPYAKAARVKRQSAFSVPGSDYRKKVLTKNKESGYVDFHRAILDVDLNGEVYQLNVVPQGAGTSERVGKKIMMKSLQLKGFSYNFSNAAYNVASLMIIYDSRPTGTLPVMTDILTSSKSTAMSNDNNTKRFKILKRLQFVMNGPATAAGATANSAVCVDEYLRLNLPVVFKDYGTGAIGDVEEGALYLVTCGEFDDLDVAAYLDVSSRLRYIDY